MIYTNRYNLPDAIVQAVKNDPYFLEARGDISVTQLIDSPRIRMLYKLYAGTMEIDVSDQIWALWGQAVHEVLARAQVNTLQERRLFTTVNGWRVSGRFDRMVINPEGAVLQDYKVTSVWNFKQPNHLDWERQLNCYRYLALKNGMTVDKLQTIAILRDWSQSRVEADPNYPKTQIVTVDIPVWPDAQIESYILERVKLHQSAETEGMPLCTLVEKWQREEIFAVRKPNRKAVVKVFGNLAAAQAFAESLTDGFVEVQPSEPMRCKRYCSVASYCQEHLQRQQQTPEEQYAAYEEAVSALLPA